MLAPWQKAIDNMLDVPYVFTQKKMVSIKRPLFSTYSDHDRFATQSEGMAEPCFVTSQIEKEGGKKLSPEREEAIKLTANAIWGGEYILFVLVKYCSGAYGSSVLRIGASDTVRVFPMPTSVCDSSD